MRRCEVCSVEKSAADLSFMTTRRTVCFTSSCSATMVVAISQVSCGNFMRRPALRLRKKTSAASVGWPSLRPPSLKIDSKMKVKVPLAP